MKTTVKGHLVECSVQEFKELIGIEKEPASLSNVAPDIPSIAEIRYADWKIPPTKKKKKSYVSILSKRKETPKKRRTRWSSERWAKLFGKNLQDVVKEYAPKEDMINSDVRKLAYKIIKDYKLHPSPVRVRKIMGSIVFISRDLRKQTKEEQTSGKVESTTKVLPKRLPSTRETLISYVREYVKMHSVFTKADLFDYLMILFKERLGENSIEAYMYTELKKIKDSGSLLKDDDGNYYTKGYEKPKEDEDIKPQEEKHE